MTVHVRINMQVSEHLLPRLMQTLREQVALHDGVGNQTMTADVHHHGEKTELRGYNQRAWLAVASPQPVAPPPKPETVKRIKGGTP